MMKGTMKTQPKLVIVRGVPGSGKTYLTSVLADTIGREAVCVLDPDTVDLDGDAQYLALSAQLAAEGVDKKFHLYRYLRMQAYEAIENGKTILWNQPFIDFNGFEVTVKRLREYAADHGQELSVLVVEVEVPESTARARVERGLSKVGMDLATLCLSVFFVSIEASRMTATLPTG